MTACADARFDGGPDDPRTLVHEYQQLMRTDLLAEVGEEAAEELRSGRWHVTFAACRGALASCEDGLRWLWLSEPRRSTRHQMIAPDSAARSADTLLVGATTATASTPQVNLDPLDASATRGSVARPSGNLERGATSESSLVQAAVPETQGAETASQVVPVPTDAAGFTVQHPERELALAA